jgi:hypothetical protein
MRMFGLAGNPGTTNLFEVCELPSALRRYALSPQTN